MAEVMRQLGYHEIYDQMHLYKTYAIWDKAMHSKATPEMWKSMFNGYKAYPHSCSGNKSLRLSRMPWSRAEREASAGGPRCSSAI